MTTPKITFSFADLLAMSPSAALSVLQQRLATPALVRANTALIVDAVAAIREHPQAAALFRRDYDTQRLVPKRSAAELDQLIEKGGFVASEDAKREKGRQPITQVKDKTSFAAQLLLAIPHMQATARKAFDGLLAAMAVPSSAATVLDKLPTSEWAPYLTRMIDGGAKPDKVVPLLLNVLSQRSGHEERLAVAREIFCFLAGHPETLDKLESITGHQHELLLEYSDQLQPTLGPQDTRAPWGQLALRMAHEKDLLAALEPRHLHRVSPESRGQEIAAALANPAPFVQQLGWPRMTRAQAIEHCVARGPLFPGLLAHTLARGLAIAPLATIRSLHQPLQWALTQDGAYVAAFGYYWSKQPDTTPLAIGANLDERKAASDILGRLDLYRAYGHRPGISLAPLFDCACYRKGEDDRLAVDLNLVRGLCARGATVGEHDHFFLAVADERRTSRKLKLSDSERAELKTLLQATAAAAAARDALADVDAPKARKRALTA